MYGIKNKLSLYSKPWSFLGSFIVVATFLIFSPKMTLAQTYKPASVDFAGVITGTNFTVGTPDLGCAVRFEGSLGSASGGTAIPGICSPNGNPFTVGFDLDTVGGTNTDVILYWTNASSVVSSTTAQEYSLFTNTGGVWTLYSDVSTSTKITQLYYPPNNQTATTTIQHFNVQIFTNNVDTPNASTICLNLIDTSVQQSPIPQCQNITSSAYSDYQWNLPVRVDNQYVWYATIQGTGTTSATIYARSLSRVFCVVQCTEDPNMTPLPGLDDDTATSTVLNIAQSTFVVLRGSFLDKFPFNWLIESGAILVQLPNITSSSTPIATTTIDFGNSNYILINRAFPTTTHPARDLNVNFFTFSTFTRVGNIPEYQFLVDLISNIMIISTVLYLGKQSLSLIKQV